MGVGLIIDHGGADEYVGTQWSLGAGFYGVGAVLDLGGGNDVFTSESFSQAIGGPRGYGLILNAQGRDLYRNNGPVASVYGTDAVFAGISQGVGFGVLGSLTSTWSWKNWEVCERMISAASSAAFDCVMNW